jgi:hypothetical protein
MNNYANTPKPPSLHWGVVLVLSIATFGLFAFFWMFRQARFAKKIDPTNKAPLQILMSLVLFLFALLMNGLVAMTVARGGQASDLGPMSSVIRFFEFFMLVSAYLQIRKTLTKHYGIQLNALWTVLFNVFYVQHSLSRIAKQEGLSMSTAQVRA